MRVNFRNFHSLHFTVKIVKSWAVCQFPLTINLFLRQSWLHWKQGIRLLFLDSNEAGGRWSSLKVINLLKSDTTCITSPSTTDLSSYLNPLTNNISLWKGIEKPIQSLLPKQQPFHSFIDDEYWIRARLLRRPIEGNFSTWAYLLTQLKLISRKIF